MSSKKLKIVDINREKLQEKINKLVEQEEKERELQKEIENQTFEIRVKTSPTRHEILIYDHLGKLEYKSLVSSSKSLLKGILDNIFTDKNKFIKEEEEFKRREQNYIDGNLRDCFDDEICDGDDDVEDF